jgi:hypothetical protein
MLLGYGSDGGNYMDDEYGINLDEGAELKRDHLRQSDPAYRPINAGGTTSTASTERDRDFKKLRRLLRRSLCLSGLSRKMGRACTRRRSRWG